GQCHEGETRRTSQHAQRVTRILPQLCQIVGSRHATLPSFTDCYALLSGAVIVAESAQRERARSIRRNALVDEFARPHLDMERELGVDVRLRLGTKEPPEARPSRHSGLLLQRGRVERGEDGGGIAPPVVSFNLESGAAATREGVVLRLAIVFGR